ncbi:hypothetical protein [Nocardia sp. Marseille-Q1738]
MIKLFDRWRYPRMESHELWQPSVFGDVQFTRRALAAIAEPADETETP